MFILQHLQHRFSVIISMYTQDKSETIKLHIQDKSEEIKNKKKDKLMITIRFVDVWIKIACLITVCVKVSAIF